jgi:GH25 family lysozyme M1 (1,4-beta-N-acetylmuramidase)
MTEIKRPVVYDVSNWKDIPDFHAIDPQPYLMITKATEGTVYKDAKMFDFMAGMMSIGCHRGLYHFHRRAYGGADQAKYFLDYVNGVADDNTLLILDVEEGGETASQLWLWIETVRARRPRNRILLYSRRNILEQIFMTAPERDYFKRIPVWVAGYPASPDIYDEIPSWYIPDPTRFGPVVLWQYSEHGQVAGIIGDVDLNWITPTYAVILGDPPTGEPGEPIETGEPMKYIVIWDQGCNTRPEPNTNNMYISVLPKGSQFEVTGWLVPVGKTREQEEWGKLQTGEWTALTYNSAPRAVPLPAEPTDPEPADTITVNVEATITATINGRTYTGVARLEGLELE